MVTVVNALFENQQTFFREWKQYEPEVIAALELVSITMYASTKEFPWNDDFRNIRSWKLFSKLAARVSIAVLAEPAVINNQKKWIQSMSSIEVNLKSLLILLPFLTLKKKLFFSDQYSSWRSSRSS